MNAMEIGQDLVALCNADNAEQVVEKYYAPDIVSIEGQDSEAMPARLEGLEAVAQKSQWWFDNHTVHSLHASGPYVGLAPDQFVVRFEMDVTPKAGERLQMDEVGLYRVQGGRIVEEAFLYNQS
ncbi:MAG: SnoaL-like domain-containing protein [Pseudomonadales bacterium]